MSESEGEQREGRTVWIGDGEDPSCSRILIHPTLLLVRQCEIGASSSCCVVSCIVHLVLILIRAVDLDLPFVRQSSSSSSPASSRSSRAEAIPHPRIPFEADQTGTPCNELKKYNYQ